MNRYIIILMIIFFINTLSFGIEQVKEKYKTNVVIKGQVIDADSGEKVEFASVSLQRLRGSKIVDGALTNSKGVFELKNVDLGKYILKIDFIGYKRFERKDIEVKPQDELIDLGQIKLQLDIDILNDVVVTSERTYIENKIDKKVVNIGKDLLTAGASATDIMSNLPSVSVDMDGNVSLRGNDNVRILVDGRPTNMSSEELLATIPAENIEKVEIITNPSAKYDPDGISGILNIVLKKNKKLGFNGSATVGVGSANEFSGFNKYNSSLNMGYNGGKINVFANYSNRDRESISTGGFERLLKRKGGAEELLEQTKYVTRIRASQSLKTGVGYAITPKDDITYTANIRKSRRASENRLNYKFPAEDRNTEKDSYDNSVSHDIIYKHDYNKKTYLEINAYILNSKNTADSFFKTKNSKIEEQVEKDENIGSNSIATLQADFTKSKNNYKLEFGVKGNYRNLDSDYKYSVKESSDFALDENRSDHYIYDEYIYSAYTNYGYKMKNWSLQAGIRLEQVYTESGLKDSKDSYDNDYFNYYPSIFLVRKLGEKKEVGVSYSKRVSRPSTWQLNPARRYTDTLNVRVGNPYLNPEFTSSLEASFNQYWKGGSFNSSVFYRKTTDRIQRISTVNDNGVSVLTYGNISTSHELGIEASTRTKIKEWWDINANVNVYYINLVTDDSYFNNNGINWFTRVNNTFKIPKTTWSVQATGTYRGKRVIAQGYIEPMYGADLGIKKIVFKKKGTLGFRISDIFNTYKFTYHTIGENFEKKGYGKWESRVAYINFTYNFGKPNKKNIRTKSEKMESSTGGDMF